MQKFLADIKSNLSLRFYNNYFGFSMKNLKIFNSSQVIRNILLEVNSFAAIFQNFFLNLISEALIILFILFFLFSYDVQITLVATIFNIKCRYNLLCF